MGRKTFAVAAFAANVLLCAIAAPIRAEPPLLREIASTTIASGKPVGLSLGPDGSVYLLIEDPKALDFSTRHDPRRWAKPHLLKLERSGAIGARIEFGRLSDGETGRNTGAPFILTPRGRSPVAMLAGGGMMVFSAGSDPGRVARFDATGKQVYSKPLQWGKPAAFRGELAVIDVTADGGVIVNGGLIANVQWVLKVSGDGRVAWSKSLGDAGNLYSYRAEPGGNGWIAWRQVRRTGDREIDSDHVARLDARGAELTHARIGCDVRTAALFQSGVIAACKDARENLSLTLFDLAGRKLREKPWTWSASFITDRDGILLIANDVLESYDTALTLRWRSPKMSMQDFVRTPEGDVVILTEDADTRRAIRYRTP